MYSQSKKHLASWAERNLSCIAKRERLLHQTKVSKIFGIRSIFWDENIYVIRRENNFIVPVIIIRRILSHLHEIDDYMKKSTSCHLVPMPMTCGIRLKYAHSTFCHITASNKQNNFFQRYSV